jgi:two-component system response regulator VicR
MSKVLIVDDDKLIVSALSIRLRAENLEVLCAHDGAEAVLKAKSSRPDLIIMDINLPLSSGLKSVHQIREALGSSDTPVIFLTASKVPALRAQAEAMGAAGFLEKPYEARKMLALVRSALAPRIASTDAGATTAESRPALAVEGTGQGEKKG